MKQEALPDVLQPWPQFVAAYLRLLLDGARRAHRQMNKREPEAIHEFRVAIRRLHTWLSLPELRPAAERKLLKTLKRYIKVTNTLRDADVHNQWLKQHGYSEQISRKQHVFPGGWKRLCRRLQTVIKSIEHSDASRNDSFSSHGTCVARALFEKFELSLLDIRSMEDTRAIHHSRILGKRLRYILEPFAPSDEQAAQIVLQLAAFQDCTGLLHDLAMMGDPLLPGATLRMHIEQEMQSLYQDFESCYLEENAPLLQCLRRWLALSAHATD